MFVYDSSGDIAGTVGDIASSFSSSIDSSLVPYAGQLTAGSSTVSSGMSTSTLMLIAGGIILAIVLLGGKR